jgi:uncharacterized lipoprotein YehR (DUF1307 family)
MAKSLVALAFVVALAGCAGTPRNAASVSEECKMVDQDNSDSHIKVHRECKSDADEHGQSKDQQQVGAN